MSTPSPSPNRTTQRRRRDGLLPLVLIALLLAVLPVGCVAEVALRLITPNDDPFKDVGSSTGLGAYRPFPPGISFAAIDPNLGNLQATEVARREQAPVGISGAVTVAPVAQVPPALAVTVPPTPTATTPPTPRPTVTPILAGTPPAGGQLPSPTATSIVVLPGITATPLPSATASNTPTATVPRPDSTPTLVPPATQLPTSSVTPIAPTVAATQTGTAQPSATPVPATPTSVPTVPPPTRTPTTAPTGTPDASETTPPATPSATSTLPIVQPPSATPVPPSETPEPPTETPVLPTETPEPPTETPEPPPPPEITINSAAITEGDSGTRVLTLTVSLSRPAPGPVSVDWATGPTGTANQATGGDSATTPGADYVSANGTVNFVAGQQQQTITVTIIGDTLFELDEIFYVTLANPSGGVITIGTGTGIINNDDTATVTSGLAARTVVEGDSGNTAVSFTLTLAQPAGRAISIPWRTLDGTATVADNDYVGVTAGSVTFAPGATTATITTQIIGDTRGEQDETYTVQLLTPPAGVSYAGPTTATITIENDDPASVSVSDAGSFTEGTPPATGPNAIFTVSISIAPSDDVVINYGTTGDSATEDVDFTGRSGSLTFTPTGPLSQQVVVPIIADALDEIDERFFLDIQRDPLTNPDVATMADGRGAATILDDDGPDVSLGSDQAVAEGTPPGPGGVLNFPVTLSAASPQDITVRYSVSDGTATRADNDYTVPAGTRTLVIPAGATGGTIVVPVVPDANLELDETLLVTLGSPTNGFLGQASSATGTIIADDFVFASVAVTPVDPIVEGNSGTTPVNVAVTIDRAAPAPITLDLQVVGGTADGADYIFTPQLLTFTPAGALTQNATLQVVGDLVIEETESIVVGLLPPSPEYVRLGTAQQTITITNDDFPTISVAGAAVDEGNTGTTPLNFTLSLSQPAPFPVSVTYTTANGTATAGSDYVAATGTATFAANQATLQLPVNVIGDLVIEEDETFTLQLSAPTNGTIATGTATGTIRNDDLVMLDVDKSGDPGDAGPPFDSLTWTFTVRNTNPAGGATIQFEIADTMPTNLERQGNPLVASPSGDDIFYGFGDDVVYMSGTLPPGDVATFTIGLLFIDPFPDCVTVPNPSYTITEDGNTYAPITGDAPVDVGRACANEGLIAPVWRPARSLIVPAELPTPTPTATLTPTPTATATRTPTATPTAEPSATAEPTSTTEPTATAEPSVTPTATGTATPEPTPTRRPTRVPTDEPEPTATPAPSATREPTRTPTSAPTGTPEPTATREPTRTPTSAPTGTPEPTRTPTAAPEPTPEPTAAPKPTRTPTAASTSTPEPSETPEPTATQPPAEPTRPPEPTPRRATATPTPQPTLEPTPVGATASTPTPAK